MSSRLRTLVEQLRTGFWAVPTLCVLLAAALALGMVQVDRALADGLGRVTFGAGADGAREVLGAITTSMITFTGLVFSITIVVLSLTSSQFSPRVLRTFLRDRQTQASLGVFIGTFVYAVLVLRTVSGLEDDTFVPAVATTGGVLLLLVCVGVFVAYIHHITSMIQISSILASISGEARAVLEQQMPTGLPPTPLVIRPRGPVAVLPAPRSGVLVDLDVGSLVCLARDADVALVSKLDYGGFVPEGAPLLEVHRGDAGRLDAKAAVHAFRLGQERTMQRDVAFGFRQLADIAAKALSPGVNDPTSAVQALDGLHDLLRRLATRTLPTGAHADEQGQIRLYLPQPHFQDYLSLALDESDQYGADSVQVQQRITALLDDVCAAALPEHRGALEARIAARAEKGLPSPSCPGDRTPPMILKTQRLDLHPLPLPVLEALLAGDADGADALVPFHVRADSFADDAYVLGLRADQLLADPAELPWLYRAAVLRTTGEVVARAGFHSRPDAEGTVEIGYRVATQHRRQGLATEIVTAMLAWAGSAGAVRCLGSTRPDNVASQAVLARLGFVRTGEQVDEIDGPEWVFTREPLPGGGGLR